MNGEPAATQLLERDRELERLAALLTDTAAGEGGLAIVEGPAGVGKTSLLLSLREQARARGLTTLSATGAQLEGAFPFGVCHQLLNEVMAGLSPAERLEVLSGAAAHARPLFGEAPEPGPGPPGGDPLFSVVHGLYWLAANLAERSPLLVLVDDAQWVDEPSLRLLDYLGRRLEGLPIGLVVALRSGEPARERKALGALRSQPGASLVQLNPLSDEGVATVVRRARRSATDLFCRECAEATGGNPFYLRELLSGGKLPARGVESIARSVLSRIERLGPEAEALTSAMAVLGDRIPIRWAASLGGLEPGEAASAADTLVGAEILEVDSDRMGFAHPIVRESVYANLPSARRAADHARAAEILSDEAAPADAIASQLLRGERLGNEWAVAALRSAAEEANRAGAPDVAAGYLRRALEEPPPPDDRPRLLLDAGLAEMLAADPRTIEHLQEALKIADEPAVRATAAAALAAVLAFLARADDAATVLRDALRTLDEDERNLRGWLRGELIVMGLVDLRAKELVAEELEVARGEEPTSPPLLAVLAYEALTGGTADEAAELADRALHEGGLLAALPIEHPSVFFSISTLIATDRREQAERCLDAAAASAVSSGSLRAYAAVTCLRGRAGYRWGRIKEAESEARTALTLIVEHDWSVGKALGAAALADALVERGELERAKDVLDLVEPAREDDDSHGFQQWRETHARLMLNLGSPEKTLEAARACERWESHWGTHNPVFSQCPWRSTAALAHLALDDTDAAVASALEALEITEAFGDPHSAGVAMRVAGMVHEGDKRLDYLRSAVDVLAQSSSRLAHARALVDLGSSLRIAGRRRDAREPLAAGLELAHECGGTALENRASEELRISGARPRARFSTGVDSLTPSELRVAGMAAEGRSNPEIAQSLFVTRKTVEMHLSNAYRKLDVAGREDLAEALGGAPSSAEALRS